ncbi:TetR/AcrR family transcriptional regulator [Herbiconiux sp.]|uniref:TetR/AcrR family transcriptional regulator n=1 Tax=Herbiconiux sp. TaxID=1871186 RepID=UPI0025B7C197|nr:TetR/AcrR family transcriptional regulator [Herbiconiux sp.]
MPKVSDDHRAERRRQIAAAALRCFARKGFEGTSMADIIAESGLSAGAIYLHYANKHELIAHVVGDVLRGRGRDLEGLSELDPLPHPVQVMRTFVTGITSELGGTAMMVQVWGLAAREPELALVIGEFIGDLRSLYASYFRAWFVQAGLTDAAAGARADAIVPVVVGICQGYLLQSAIAPAFDAEQYLAAVELLDFAAAPAS